ncbi:MAG TPA: hypothetical protein V6D47_11845 [Oscillatoriaceae cyanobacterium]
MSTTSALLGMLAVCLLAAPAFAEPTFSVHDTASPDAVDNLRIGIAQFDTPALSRLFDGGRAISAGLDLPLSGGLAVSFDTYDLFGMRGAAANDVLSLDPLQLRYRFALPGGMSPITQPYASLGGGLGLMGVIGDALPLPRAGIGPVASASVGMELPQGFTVELSVNGGQSAQMPYYAWQLRLGSGFRDLGDLGALGRWAFAGRSEDGVVRAVRGDRLQIALAPNARLRVGDELAIEYHSWTEMRVAHVRVLAVSSDGVAIARVLRATETIKPGYQVHAW